VRSTSNDVQVAATFRTYNFTGFSVSSVTDVRTEIFPQCGNGFCEVHETDRTRPELCLADCQSLGWCPVALKSSPVGKVGAVCGNIGVCKPAIRQCSCPPGHGGEACTRCEFGFVPRGVISRGALRRLLCSALT
jgi:hypothetical protein